MAKLPVNPLYPRWCQVAAARAGMTALRDPAGTTLTFAQLAGLAATAPTTPPILHTRARGVALVVDTLRAWRDGSVLVPDDGSGVPPPAAACLTPDICHLKLTSGSTGTPRHVKFRAEQLAADAAHIVATMGLRPDWPNLGVLSMAHSYGFSNLVLPLLLHGIPLHLLDSPLPETLRVALASGGPVTLAAVPAMWQAWHGVGVALEPVRLAISAGAPLPLPLEQAVFERCGLKIHNFYGSSECGGIAYDRTTVPRSDLAVAGSAMDGVALEVDDATGRLRVISPAVADGYVGASDPADAPCQGAWLAPDLAGLDAGVVRLLGRAGDFISVAGHKIPPAVIEDILSRLPGVRHCLVFGVPSPNPIRVEDIVACVALEPGAELTALKAAFEAHPSTYGPRHWWVCPELRPDARGKLSRHHWRQVWLQARAE